jgi:hypothetical protein
MTEAEWLTCTDPTPMLEFIRGNVSERKLRLFAVACCRHIWHLLNDQRSREAVLVVERYSEGSASSKELTAARKMARAAAEVTEAAAQEAEFAGAAALLGIGPQARRVIRKAMKARAVAAVSATALRATDPRISPGAVGATVLATKAVKSKQVLSLMYDIFGNPFRPITTDPSLLVWNDGTIPKLAQAIYDKRAFDRLPILADALQEAGCTDPDILAHCRSGGEHVRGCWVVDLILGKS